MFVCVCLCDVCLSVDLSVCRRLPVLSSVFGVFVCECLCVCLSICVYMRLHLEFAEVTVAVSVVRVYDADATPPVVMNHLRETAHMLRGSVLSI